MSSPDEKCYDHICMSICSTTQPCGNGDCICPEISTGTGYCGESGYCVDCSPEVACNDACCSSGEICSNYVCCPQGYLGCSTDNNTCCSSDQVCYAGSCVTCPSGTIGCGEFCCTDSQTCTTCEVPIYY